MADLPWIWTRGLLLAYATSPPRIYRFESPHFGSQFHRKRQTPPTPKPESIGGSGCLRVLTLLLSSLGQACLTGFHMRLRSFERRLQQITVCEVLQNGWGTDWRRLGLETPGRERCSSKGVVVLTGCIACLTSGGERCLDCRSISLRRSHIPATLPAGSVSAGQKCRTLVDGQARSDRDRQPVAFAMTASDACVLQTPASCKRDQFSI